MDFEWDDFKSDNCFIKRGFDFEAVIDVFRDPYRLVELDDRWDYGEERLRLIGKLDEKNLCSYLYSSIEFSSNNFCPKSER